MVPLPQQRMEEHQLLLVLLVLVLVVVARKDLRSNLMNDSDESSHRRDKRAEAALAALVPRLDKFVPFYEDNRVRLGGEPRSSVEAVRAYRRRMGNSSTHARNAYAHIYITRVMLVGVG